MTDEAILKQAEEYLRNAYNSQSSEMAKTALLVSQASSLLVIARNSVPEEEVNIIQDADPPPSPPT